MLLSERTVMRARYHTIWLWVKDHLLLIATMALVIIGLISLILLLIPLLKPAAAPTPPSMSVSPVEEVNNGYIRATIQNESGGVNVKNIIVYAVFPQFLEKLVVQGPLYPDYYFETPALAKLGASGGTFTILLCTQIENGTWWSKTYTAGNQKINTPVPSSKIKKDANCPNYAAAIAERGIPTKKVSEYGLHNSSGSQKLTLIPVLQ